MLDKLYLTPKQWRRILRWTLYSLLFLSALIAETVILGRDGFWGQSLALSPLVIVCVAMREGPERGGLFALLTSSFLALSGADQGPLQLLCLTVLSICGSHFSRKIFSVEYLPSLLCSGLFLLVTQTLCFLLKVFYQGIPRQLYLTRLIPGILVSLLFQPLIYWLVKSIEKIGDPYEAT